MMIMTFLTRSAFFGVLIGLTGCATMAPEFDRLPQDSFLVGDSWVSAHTALTTETLTDGLLDLFDDDALRQFVENSQQRNLALLQQKSATAAVAARVTQANSTLYPNANLTIDSDRQGAAGMTSESHNLSIDVSWELDLWGRWRAELNAVVSDYEAAKSNYQFVKDDIAAQTMLAYIDAVSQSQLAALSDEKYLSFDKTMHVVLSKYQTGTTDLDALTESRQNLASANVERFEFKLSQRNAMRSLQVLAGQYPDGVDLVGTTLPALMPPPRVELPAEVLAKRPDVKAAWLSVQSAASTVAAKEAAQLPNISLTTSLGKSSDALKNLLTGDTVWQLATSIGYSLFDSSNLKAQITETESLAEQKYYQYLETVLMVLNEVETALDSEQAYYNTEIAQREVVAQSRLLLANSEQDYRDGLLDITDWLLFQRSFFDAESKLIDIVNQRLQNRINLGLALGLSV